MRYAGTLAEGVDTMSLKLDFDLGEIIHVSRWCIGGLFRTNEAFDIFDLTHRPEFNTTHLNGLMSLLYRVMRGYGR